ncbi:MAG: hypothetical protein GX207_06380 [Peptococcaceae bacterium]|nr:hypothetical protein [Peptococcaceae bacterium]
MTTSPNSTQSILSIVIKLVIFIAALYVSYRVLKPLLSIILGISFWIIKLLVFIAVGLLLVHLFLKLIFGIDLWQKLKNNSWRI